jgi:hypothetical protein
MDWRLLLANGVTMGGLAWMSVVGIHREAGQVLKSDGSEIARLEDEAALTQKPGPVAELAAAYLDRDQPGLASAVIERAPARVRNEPRVATLEARALYGRGQAREALAVARSVQESLGKVCGESSASDACPTWLVAKSTHQLAFLEEVVAAGIDDPYSDPDATRAAYERSTRAVRLVAVR